MKKLLFVIILIALVFGGMGFGISLESKLQGLEIFDVIEEEEAPKGSVETLSLQVKLKGVEIEDYVAIYTDITPKGIVDSYMQLLEKKIDGLEISDELRIADENVPQSPFVKTYGDRLKDKLTGIEIESSAFAEK